jgi:hypothetical protein
LWTGGASTYANQVNTLHLCSEMCRLYAEAMTCGSILQSALCDSCAELCAACAEVCLGMEDELPQMRECRSACLRCFDSCVAIGA